MKNPKDQYILCKTFISDNGIDRVFRPLLEKGEYEQRKVLLEKSCIYIMMELERESQSTL